MNIILLGAPFSGKGTLARQMVADFGLTQISTGDLFRENIKNGTEIGLLAKSYMDKGQLVPDSVTITMLKERISHDDCKKGFILDGFPRTLGQAEELEKIAKIDTVIQLDVSFDEIRRRCLGRRTCSKCGEIYNTSTYDKSTCKLCGSPLFQRDDDNLETVNNRLEVYENMTAPLINFYADRLFVVEGSETPQQTYEPVKNFLKGLIK
ncbi:MAG: adenylate kinase [Clostridiales bacterium]|nr:adenylate kinase [Clostridiales bacterium]